MVLDILNVLLLDDDLLSPSLLALRLRRVQVLFGEAALHPDMKRYWYLRNIYLLAFALAITGIQVVRFLFFSVENRNSLFQR